MKRKGSAGITLTWIVGTIVLVMGSVFFILGVSTIAVKDVVGDVFSDSATGISVKEGRLDFDLSLQRSFESFLNKKVVLDGEEMKMSELIEKSNPEDKEAVEIFRENSESVFLELLPFPMDNWAGVDPLWVRVYEKGEKMGNVDVGRKFHVGGHNCHPNDREKSLIISSFVGDKKVVLCVFKSYYEFWRKNKHK